MIYFQVIALLNIIMLRQKEIFLPKILMD